MEVTPVACHTRKRLSATRAMRVLPLSHWCPKGAESAGSGQGPVLSASCFPCHISALTCIVLPAPVLLRRLPGRPLAAKDKVAVTRLGSRGLNPKSLEATSPRLLTAVLVFSPAWLCVPTSGSLAWWGPRPGHLPAREHCRHLGSGQVSPPTGVNVSCFQTWMVRVPGRPCALRGRRGT